MATRFPSFPACCQPLLEDLDRQNKEGARNCPKGHLVSLDYARMIEAERARTEAEEARKAAEVKPSTSTPGAPTETKPDASAA